MTYSEQDVREIFTMSEAVRALRDEIDDSGLSATAWAPAHGFGQSFVAKVLRGDLAMSDRLAKEIGFERVVVFRACNPKKQGS